MAALSAFARVETPGQQALSNINETVALADQQVNAGNYADGIVLYDQALDALTSLMKGGYVDPEQQRPFLVTIRNKRDAQVPMARRADFRNLYKAYQAARVSFVTAMNATSVFNMNIALTHADRLLDTLLGIYPRGERPVDLPSVQDTYDLHTVYAQALQAERAAWQQQLAPTGPQRDVLADLLSATSLAVHIRMLDRAEQSAIPDVTLQWLHKVYAGLVQQEPCTFAFWYGLGNSAQLLGWTNVANSAWHDALEFFPDSLYVHYHLARTCGASSNESARAIMHLRWVIANAQNPLWRAKGYHQLAERSLRMGNYSSAEQQARLAAEIAEDGGSAEGGALYIEARRTQAEALFEQGNDQGAIDALSGAVASSGGNPATKIHLAALIERIASTGPEVDAPRAEEAVRLYDEIQRAEPSNAVVRVRKAYLCWAMGNTVRAQREALEQIRLYPRTASAMAILGHAYLKNGDTNTACVFYRKALDIDPLNESATRALNRIEGIEVPNLLE